jgi:hypothetical protein
LPDAKTNWLYRERLAPAGAAERLFARFDGLMRCCGGEPGSDGGSDHRREVSEFVGRV